MDFDDCQVSNNPKVLSNTNVVFDDPSMSSMDFDNTKVYGDTSILDGLVFYENQNLASNIFWGKFCTFYPP